MRCVGGAFGCLSSPFWAWFGGSVWVWGLCVVAPLPSRLCGSPPPLAGVCWWCVPPPPPLRALLPLSLFRVAWGGVPLVPCPGLPGCGGLGGVLVVGSGPFPWCFPFGGADACTPCQGVTLLYGPSICSRSVQMDLLRSQVLQPFPTPGSGTLWVAGESLRDRRVSCLPRWTVCPTRSPLPGPNRSTCRGECSSSGPLVTPRGRCHRGPLTNGPGRIPPYCVCSGGADTVTGGAPKTPEVGSLACVFLGPFSSRPTFCCVVCGGGFPVSPGWGGGGGGRFLLFLAVLLVCVSPPPLVVVRRRCVCSRRGACARGVCVGVCVGRSWRRGCGCAFRACWCVCVRAWVCGWGRLRLAAGVGVGVVGVCRGWSLVGWGPLAAVVCGVWCVVCGVWCAAVVCWWGCGWCVVWLISRHSLRSFLCATPCHSWLGFAAGGGGRSSPLLAEGPGRGSPPLLAGVRWRRWCVVGLLLVCGVVGPSPLLAEVPVCYSPPLLAGFRCRWWCVVCGVWCVVCGVRRWCVGGVVAGVWCGWSLATPGGGSCVLLPATPGRVSLPVVVGGPRHSWLRAPGAVPRHSWLGSAGGGAVSWGCGWCVVWLVPHHSWRRFLCATPPRRHRTHTLY